MNKTELVLAVAERAHLQRKDADAAVNAVLEAISEALAEGDDVRLMGFGTFEVKHRAARMGVNPQTGEPMEIAASTLPSFKAGRLLKEAVSK